MTVVSPMLQEADYFYYKVDLFVKSDYFNLVSANNYHMYLNNLTPDSQLL